MSKTTSTSPLASTILSAAREWTASRGHKALADAHALHIAAGGRGSYTGPSRDVEPEDACGWLADCFGREPSLDEQLAYAAAIRFVAREWTTEARDEARATGDVSLHLDGALYDDARRNWGTSTTLPADREAAAEWARAAVGLDRKFSATADTERAPSFSCSDFDAAAAE